MTTLMGGEKLRTREDECRSLFLNVLSDENLSFEVFEISKPKGFSFDVLDEFVCSFKLSVRIGAGHGIGYTLGMS